MTISLKTAASRRPEKARGDSGNVLFLILIAVALFAALSYAVTQSTRSGGGDASSETNLINSSQITQYPAALKTAMTRMIVSNSVSPYAMTFDDPSLFAANLTTSSLEQENVFHPNGGGSTYSLGPDTVIDTAINASKAWVFNTENQIENIGQTNGAGPDDTTSDTIAFLPGVKLAICQKIHSQLGLSTTIPTETNIDFATDQTTAVGTSSDRIYTGAGTGTIGDSNILSGQPQGCFQQGANTYVYYHVLIER
ncbi:MAG: hypothetical protein IAE63_01490 [Alphaproteobacteria bacterium]|jgi:hypothetical protein|nr:hypothetical protein [Alphaproteobacteria bacterium]